MSYSGVSFVNFEQINVGLACSEACIGPYHTSLIKHFATVANGFSKYASNGNCSFWINCKVFILLCLCYGELKGSVKCCHLFCEGPWITCL